MPQQLQLAPAVSQIQMAPMTPQPLMYLPQNVLVPAAGALPQASSIVPVTPPAGQTAIPKHSELRVVLPAQAMQPPSQGQVWGQFVQSGVPMNMQPAGGTFVSQMPQAAPQAVAMAQAMVVPAAAAYNMQPGQTFSGTSQAPRNYAVGQGGQQYQGTGVPLCMTGVCIALAISISM